MSSPRSLLLLTGLLALLIAGPASARSDHGKRGHQQKGHGHRGHHGHHHPRGNVKLQRLGINDFHGNLEPPTGSGGRIIETPGRRRATPAAPSSWPATSASCSKATATR
jgi:hypothetical protein